jgi:hypothetical protein
METPNMPSHFLAETSVDRLTALSRKMSQDPSRFEAASRDSEIAREEMSSCGMPVEPGVEVRLVRQEADVIHFTIPVDPNAELAEKDLAHTSASGVSTAGTLSTIPSCFLTASTYGNIEV